MPLAPAEWASPAVATGDERNSSLEVNEMADTEARAAGAEASLAVFGDTADAGKEANDEGRADFRFTALFSAVEPVETSVALRAEKINLASASASPCGDAVDDKVNGGGGGGEDGTSGSIDGELAV